MGLKEGGVTYAGAHRLPAAEALAKVEALKAKIVGAR